MGGGLIEGVPPHETHCATHVRVSCLSIAKYMVAVKMEYDLKSSINIAGFIS